MWEAFGVLDDTERQRSACFLRAEDRNSFIVTHAALRCLLSSLLDVAPGGIQFATNSLGKPSLSPVHGRDDISFSLSHTTGFSAIALSRGGEIGIDIERRRAVSDPIGIVLRLFGGAVAEQFARHPPEKRDEIFLRLWTTAEAYAKARGVGLAGIGRTSPVLLATDGSPSLDPESTLRTPWILLFMEAADECVGGVVVASSNAIACRSHLPETTTLAALLAAGPW